MVVVAFSALGFGLFTAPVLENLFLEDDFGLDAFERGVSGTAGGVCAVAVLIWVGPKFDRLWREDPTRIMQLIGMGIAIAGILKPVQFFMPNVPLFVAAGIPSTILLASSFTMVGPILQSIVPYRLRGSGSALVTLYIFFVGATGGGLISFMFTDTWGPRITVIVLTLPSSVIGLSLIHI